VDYSAVPVNYKKRSKAEKERVAALAKQKPVVHGGPNANGTFAKKV
jgi:hypothetical protein